ncbi:hypothetical protein IMSAG049_01127 [Clostridiales bacterium]|nr:hypothetical protein IMSAG049_01127 [Clostridiales bacterium]
MTEKERQAIAEEIINIYKSHDLSLWDIQYVNNAVEHLLLTKVRMQGQDI